MLMLLVSIKFAIPTPHNFIHSLDNIICFFLLQHSRIFALLFIHEFFFYTLQKKIKTLRFIKRLKLIHADALEKTLGENGDGKYS